MEHIAIMINMSNVIANTRSFPKRHASSYSTRDVVELQVDIRRSDATSMMLISPLAIKG